MGKVLAIVPAKGTSRRLPGKNLRPLAGVPLARYSVEIARAGPAIDRVCVDSDDPEIQRLAKSWGAESPTLRSPTLAAPDVHAVHVVLGRLDEYREMGWSPDVVVMLLPTNPFRSTDDVARAIEMVREDPSNTVVSVSPLGRGLPQLKRVRDDLVEDVVPPPSANFQSAEVEKLFALNGSIYAAQTNLLRKEGTFQGPKRRALMMHPRAMVDIDDAADFEFAEDIMQSLMRSRPEGYEWLAHVQGLRDSH